MQLPSVSLVASSKANTLALGWSQGEAKEGKEAKGASRPVPVFGGKDPKNLEKLKGQLLQSQHFGGKKNEADLLRFYTHDTFENIVLLGLGSAKNWTTEVARQIGAALLLLQRRERIARVALDASSIFVKAEGKNLAAEVQAFVEGYCLAGYEYRDQKKEDPNLFEVEGLDLLYLKGAAVDAAIQTGRTLAECVRFSRALGDRPGNVLTPTELGRLVQEASKVSKLKCTVWGKTEIQKEKMGLFWGVAKGSEEDPRFIIMEHNGGKKGDRPIVLVGKGITFDSGGISIKPAAKMEEMKYDMMGAAAVAGIMQAVSRLKIEKNVVGLIASCENMPDGRAQKPGDVARSRRGKTVEIINTDAEGRLILADALEYAQDTYEPAAIIDFATLTGAVIDALGTVTSGIMGNHQGLIDRIKESSEYSGERVWQLPLYDEYEEDMRSNVADIKNSGIREAGSEKGGIFLRYFVDSKFPWAHCDIAGTAWYSRHFNYNPSKFGTGVMVRLMVHLIENWKTLK